MKTLFNFITVQKTKLVSVLVVLSMAFPILSIIFAAKATFRDVPTSHWAYQYIAQAQEDGVMLGTGTDTFEPSKELTVAEFMTILVRAFYPDDLAACTAAANPWYIRPVKVAHDHNLYDKLNVVIPGASIPRSDMAAAIYMLLADKGYTLTSAQLAEVKARIPTEAGLDVETIAPAYYYGIIAGVDSAGHFAGSRYVDRAQMATIYTRLRDLIGRQSSIPADPESTTTPAPTPEPTQTVTTTIGDMTFAFINGETTVNQMMTRINAATPAYREGYLTNGKPITDENINEMLDELQKTWPQETEWSGGSKYLYTCNPKWVELWGNHSGCGAFAACVSDILFGEDAPIIKHQNFDRLKVGDVFYKGASSTFATGHIAFARSTVLEDEDDKYVWTCDGNSNDVVIWKMLTTISKLWSDSEYSTNSQVYSRY